MREEQLQLEYIELKKERFFKPVDQARVREAFELELADYKLSEERRASHIFIEVNDSRSYDQAKALAFDIESKLQEGLSFEEIAKSSSDDLGSASLGGDLGYTNGETFPEEFEQVLASLELNAVSQPVEMEGGFHIIKLTDIKALEVPKFEERKALIEQRIQSADVDAEFISMLEDLKDHVFNSDDLAGPANSLDLSVNTSGWLSRSSSESIFNSPKVKTAAFSEAVLTDGNNSEVIELSPDHFIVVRVKSHRDKEPMPLAEVEGKIQLLLQQQQARAKLEILAGELASQLQAGASIEEMAKTNNYDWQIEIGKSRNSPAVNRELLTAAFNTTSANKYEIVPLNNGAVAIITVEEINAGDLALLPAEDRQAVIQEVLRNNANWDFSWYLQSAIAGSDITTL
jgi:peptidyl-prolyl cis-trans isomerase D